jgi:putative flippase GtrA
VTRFVRFNAVGVLGFGVQLAVLTALVRAGWPVLPATLAGVEAALLHNFIWHERWTWSDVRAGTRAGRLSRFHATNGVISLAGGAAITAALVEAAVPLALANLAAALACAGANFAAAHLIVFCAKTWPTLHGHLQ